ncbi:MAG: 2Fe-2S iron-sulfur cluster-binding protein, partial [Alphaproteobacteria bacterium]|nr:2Fe-2S iron-sulfur cluster-binding protein [Alphaproteobacteria bacterium]
MPKIPEPEQPIRATTVVFMPSGLRGHFSKGTTLLAAARSLGVDIDSVCGGRGICGRCQVTVAEGEFAKLGIQSRNEHLAALADNEIRFDRRKGLLPGGRLSCSARLTGDIVIDVPAESQIHRQIVRKRTSSRTVRIDPIIRPLYVDLNEISADAPVARLRVALRKQWQIDATVQESVALQLKGDEDNLTVALREEKHVVAAWSGFRENLAGLSVDIGSTTVAAQLSNLGSGEIMSEAGIMNPQIRYGEDVMSRVSYIMLNPGGQDLLTNAIRAAIEDLATDCTQIARITRQDIVELTVVGNPIMHHLFLGLDV